MNAPLPPPSPRVQQLVQQALNALRAGRADEAGRLLSEALSSEPRRHDILHLAGMAAVQRKDKAAAAEFFGRAARAAPEVTALQINFGNALVETGRFAEALETFDRLTQREPRLADVWNGRGAALKGQGRLHGAAESYRRAAALQPANVQALCNLAGLLVNLGAPEEALALYSQAARLAPGLAEAYSGRARVLLALDQPVEALADAERALAMRPRLAEAHANRGFALETLGRQPEASSAYQSARALDPDLARKLVTRGVMLLTIDRVVEASACFKSALALDDRLAEAHMRLGQSGIGRDPELVLREVGRAIELDPAIEEAHCLFLAGALPCCEWDRVQAAVDVMQEAVREGRPTAIPFTFLTVCDSPADQRRCAETWIREHFPPAATPLATAAYNHDRVRVGYVSADFFAHPTAWLAAGVFERHDRARFETFAFSTNAPPEDAMRGRLRQAFEHFVDCDRLDDEAIAALIREREIDILIDLKGFTAGARTAIFRQRPAPVQAQWLGYPGTLGASYIDYAIADAVVIPAGDERFYTEAVVRLPGSYQPNDPDREVGPSPGRAEAGLPPTGFVFCCFNASHKIQPPVFDIWMRLLGEVERSVLWLLADNPRAQTNLRREAQARGVDPTRLIFAPRAGQADHLGRLALADLVLDTLPYGAHTTASDALWAGVPVLTCLGKAFPGRVGASLLTAIGLPELIAADFEAYETLALELARDEARLGRLKTYLRKEGRASPLFDAERFTRGWEAALAAMHERKLDNKPPQGFDVTMSDARGLA